MGKAGQAASAVLGYGCGRGENPEISEGWGHGRAPASTPGTARGQSIREGTASAGGATPARPLLVATAAGQ